MKRFKKFYKPASVPDQAKSATNSALIKKLTSVFLVFAIVIGTGATIFWYKDIYMTPERRFWSAIDNSLSTKSVIRTLTSGGTGNQVIQNNRFVFSQDDFVESRVEFTNRSATVDTFVVTEGLTTLDSQYSRYVSFDTNDTREDGSTADINNVLGEWAGVTADDESKEEARLNYVSELVTLALFGDYSSDQRSTIVGSLESSNTYRVNYDGVSEGEVDDDDEVLFYPVSVGLKSYASTLQNSFESAGLGGFPPLNPDNYREDARVNAIFAVRTRDNALVGIQFGDRSEEYSNYGALRELSVPDVKFTPEELEAIVQEEIQG